MKIKKGNLIVLLGLLLMPLVFSAYTSNAANWDGAKAKLENARWEQEIQNWDQDTANWSSERELRRNQLMTINAIDEFNREYCNTAGCWTEDMFSLGYRALNNESTMVGRKDASDATLFQKNTFNYSSVNGGQIIIYEGLQNSKLTSSNFGQVMSYRNRIGDNWESANFGQVITFAGTNGESISSSNFGQSLTNRTSDGETFGSDNFGQVIVDSVADIELINQLDMFDPFENN